MTSSDDDEEQMVRFNLGSHDEPALVTYDTVQGDHHISVEAWRLIRRKMILLEYFWTGDTDTPGDTMYRWMAWLAEAGLYDKKTHSTAREKCGTAIAGFVKRSSNDLADKHLITFRKDHEGKGLFCMLCSKEDQMPSLNPASPVFIRPGLKELVSDPNWNGRWGDNRLDLPLCPEHGTASCRESLETLCRSTSDCDAVIAALRTALASKE